MNGKEIDTMGKRTVVVIDDEPFVLSLIETILEDEGFDVVSAADGETGWARIQESSPCLVVTDVTMPGRNGLQICEACETLRKERDFPIFVLTGDTDRASQTWLRQLRNVWLVSKPFSPRAFVEQIHLALAAVESAQTQSSDAAGVSHG